MVKSGQVWSGLFVSLDATGALATPSVGPAGVLYVDGTANGATVTISGSNPYKWSVTLPTLTAGQSVSMYVTATIAAIATASVVAEDVADTKRVSDLNDAAAAPSASDNATATAAAILVTPANKLATAATGEASANVTLWAGDAVGDAPVSAVGNGAISFPVTVNDEDSNPIDGVEVWITTDSGGTNVVAGTLSTDALGVATFMLDAGDYYVWRQASGYNFTNPVAITVS